MPLTPEEEKRLREKIRKDLEERERRLRESKQREEEARQMQIEERIRQKIKEEEEEQFFKEKGYVKYINHRGEVEWLTPEEAKKRQGRRRTKKTSSRHRRRQKRKILQWAVNIGMILLAFFVFALLLKFNPIKRTKAYGSVYIKTNVPGARVFLNGAEKPLFAPDTIPHLAVGKNYFISVYKDGFSCWPPMQRITVAKNKVTVAAFQLTHSATFAQIRLLSNVPDFQLYVDGVPFPHTGNVVELPTGYHVITAIKPGYLADPSYHRILVEDKTSQELAFHFQKVKELGYLRITNNRSSSFVFLNDRLSGIKANHGYFPVKAGVYEVRVRENGFQSVPEVEMVNIAAGEKKTITFHSVAESRSDTLQIYSRTPGAVIMLDGQWLPFVTPATEILLTRGDHYLNLMHGNRVYRETDMLVDARHFEKKRLDIDF